MKFNNRLNKTFNQCFGRIITTVLLSVISTLTYGNSEVNTSNITMVTDSITPNSRYRESALNYQNVTSQYIAQLQELTLIEHLTQQKPLILKGDFTSQSWHQNSDSNALDENNTVINRTGARNITNENSKLYFILFLFALLGVKLELNARAKQ